MKMSVFCTTTFEGFHRWPNAPTETRFLCSVHRHLFHVRASKEVLEDDRAIEFITLKRELDHEILLMKNDSKSETWSCEMWARSLAEKMGLLSCEVSEDGENGALFER